MPPRPSLPIALATLLSLPILAGCLAAGPSGDEATGRARGTDLPTFHVDWAEAALVTGDDHVHEDAAQHAGLSTPNFEIIGYDPLISDDMDSTPYGYLCGDAQPTQDGRRLAVVESRSDIGFAIADVTDPLNPKHLGELVMRRTYVYDLAVVPDGEHIVLVTSLPRDPDSAEPPLRPAMSWRSACAPGGEVPVVGVAQSEDLVPRPLSILLVSIADPAQPQIIDQRPLGGIGHSVSSAIVDGRTWIVASTYAANSGLSNYQFYEVARTPAGSAYLNHLSTYILPPTTDIESFNRALGHNDAWIMAHPKTGTTLAWLAHWNHGLVIVDLTDPSFPTTVGSWTDYDPAGPIGDTGQTHSAHPLPGLWGDRHYTVIGPEHAGRPPSTPTGKIHVLDTTDPRDPFPVASWTFPHDVDWSGRLMYSLHYLTVVDTTLFVSTYHGGIWAIDLAPVAAGAVADGGWLNLDSVGAFLPTHVSPQPHAVPFRWAPTLQEVHGFEDGTLVTFDSNSGLYTFRFDASNPAPPPTPWPLGPPPGVR